MTKIKQCGCEHKFQDKKYGKGNRVFNKTMKDDGTIFRCTVCKKELRA